MLISAAFGQTDRGTITGTITDPAGAVVPNAPVEARNVETGAVYPAAASGTGNFTIAQLPAATYELSVTVPGFKKYVRTGIIVDVAAIVRADAVLEVGATTESVVVNAESPILKTESTEVSYTVPTETLDDLPILTLSGAPPGFGNSSGLGNIRNPLASVQLLPGTNFATDNTLRINGLPSSSQTINIEGQDASNGFWKQETQINQAGADAIQEVTIQTSNYAAEYGQAGGGYFNYTMKSGTNQLHGSGFDYFVNTFLNAGLPFTVSPSNPNQNIRNPIHQNDYGFTIGGPIFIPKVYNGHDKTFFFVSFEQFRQTNFTTNGIAIMPTAAERAGNFAPDEAAFLGCHGPDPAGQAVCPNEIFNPTTRRTVNGATVESPFPNNTIPASMIDPTAQIIQNMFPMPNAPGLFNYAVPGYSDYRHTTIPSIKVDQLISSKLKFSAYYSATKTLSPQTNGFSQPFTTVIPQNALAQTVRLNLDDTITPTLLLHFGAGLLHTTNPSVNPPYDQAANNLFPDGVPFPGKNFPYLSGLFASSFLPAGFSGGGPFPASTSTASFFEAPFEEDVKPTFNASATWIKGNHTFKLGATALFEGIPTITSSRANGEFEFAQTETADPWQFGQPFASTTGSGFGYASFLLGAADGLDVAPPSEGTRLGMHSYGLYLQDSWKVTRTLTLELGLRWDYATQWSEEHGRMQNAAFTLPNPTIGGRLGTVIYGATCHCTFAPAYPYSIGPHLGVAWQITPKTVFRAGGAINYAAVADQAGLNVSVPDFLGLAPPGYGLPAAILKNGDPYAPGNVYGNPVLTFQTFLNTPEYPPATSSGVTPPSSPFISIASNSARLPRIFQWSIGFQREITRDMVVEAAYVGNRGAWFTAPLLAQLNYNGLSPQQLQSKYGLNVQNPADAQLLLTPINSPLVTARFPNLANPNNVYPGFPGTEPLIAALVSYPQWYNGIPPFLGPPLGDTWYDSLQVKMTKRYSHGITAQLAYTYQKELTNGVNSNTSYLTPNAPLINDVFNPALDKQISGFDIPQALVIAFTYTTPKFSAENGGLKAVSWLARDWSISGLLRYQSGMLIRTPPSNNNLLTELGVGTSNNPALWGGGTTFYNRVPGQPLFLVDPNSHFDPTTQLVLNPAAWTDAPPGTFGTSAPYYNDFRWQRQPAESLGVGRVFRIKEGFSLQVRAEFQNVFNRLFFSPPADAVGLFGSPSTNPATPVAHGNSLGSTSGLLSGGYGYVNWLNGAGATPRSGQLVARFTF
ncbi:MAG: TonB-dependent receptor [Bryobacterales bacterium]|nr:TonB-dependent receptor [Bryobacterales bacterium]